MENLISSANSFWFLQSNEIFEFIIVKILILTSK